MGYAFRSSDGLRLITFKLVWVLVDKIIVHIKLELASVKVGLMVQLIRAGPFVGFLPSKPLELLTCDGPLSPGVYPIFQGLAVIFASPGPSMCRNARHMKVGYKPGLYRHNWVCTLLHITALANRFIALPKSLGGLGGFWDRGLVALKPGEGFLRVLGVPGSGAPKPGL